MKVELKKLGVAAAYLFGSCASGRAGPLSDFDVAVLLKNSAKERDYFAVRLKLIALFSRHFKNQKVDIVILNNAPPLLAMNCIDGSKILFESDHFSRIDFETRTTMHYLDRLPHERNYMKSLLHSV